MITTTQSKLLTQFYNDINTWISNGCPKYTNCFYSGAGLCSNLIQWVFYNKISFSTYITLDKEMTNQFKAAGLSDILPFNQGSDYTTEEKYKNPARLEWIKSHSKGDTAS